MSKLIKPSAVWEFEVPGTGDFQLKMPKGAQILTVQMQKLTPMMWALVNPNEAEVVLRNFVFVGTGHAFDSSTLTYIGTFQLANGALVFHLFERKPG